MVNVATCFFFASYGKRNKHYARQAHQNAHAFICGAFLKNKAVYFKQYRLCEYVSLAFP